MKLFLASALYCSANQADAAISSISVNASLSPQMADYSDEALSFQQFDPSLGKLKSVLITVQINSTLKQEYENTSDTDQSIRARQKLDIILQLPNATTKILNDRQTVTHNYSADAFDGDLDYGGTSGGSTEYDISTRSQKLLKSKAKMAPFIGSDLADLFLSANTTFVASEKGGGTAMTQAEALAGADVTITYNYLAAIPEPIWYGLSAGVVALVFTFWQLRQRKATSRGI